MAGNRNNVLVQLAGWMSDENVVDTDGIEFFAEDGADDLSVYERGVSLHRCTLPTPISTYKKGYVILAKKNTAKIIRRYH